MDTAKQGELVFDDKMPFVASQWVQMVDKPRIQPAYQSFVQWLFGRPKFWTVTCNYNLVTKEAKMVKLGEVVRDTLTGFKGVVVARTEYLNGCVRLSVHPVGLLDGKIQKEEYFDEQRLVTTAPVATPEPTSPAETGGPGLIPPARECPDQW